MATAAPAPAAASATPAPSIQRQPSSRRKPVLLSSGLTCWAVDRRADDTLGATVVVTASAASSMRGAAHSLAP
jgi:hypothetical protein